MTVGTGQRERPKRGGPKVLYQANFGNASPGQATYAVLTCRPVLKPGRTPESVLAFGLPVPHIWNTEHTAVS